MSANFVLVLRQSKGDEDVFKRVGSIEGESDGTRIEKSRFLEGVKMEKISILYSVESRRKQGGWLTRTGRTLRVWPQRVGILPASAAEAAAAPLESECWHKEIRLTWSA